LISQWARTNVTPQIVPLPESSKLAVGFAQSTGLALGLELDWYSLHRSVTFEDNHQHSVVSVAPVLSGDKVGFSVHRQPSSLAYGQTLESDPPLSVGQIHGAIATRRAGGNEEKVWSIPLGRTITVPSAVRHPTGHIIAFRLGGDYGTTHLGAFDQALKPKGELVEFERFARQSGPPEIARTDSHFALLTLGRDIPAARYVPYAAVGTVTELPKQVRLLELPNGGEDNYDRARLSGSDTGQFAALWSRGVPGNRHAEIVLFDTEFKVASEPVTISSRTQDALAGAVFARGKGALGLFFTHGQDGYELWATRVACE
jgi:hypothetical protein